MHLPEKDNVTKVSVVIPTLNEAHSIGATLDAISQLSRRVEVIVVDGGSDDDTREIARARGAVACRSVRIARRSAVVSSRRHQTFSRHGGANYGSARRRRGRCRKSSRPFRWATAGRAVPDVALSTSALARPLLRRLGHLCAA